MVFDSARPELSVYGIFADIGACNGYLLFGGLHVEYEMIYNSTSTIGRTGRSVIAGLN